MSSNQDKPRTIAGEWIVLIIIVVISIIVILVIFLVLEPLSSQSTTEPPDDINDGLGCPTSDAPTNLIATQTDMTAPNIDLIWDPVLTTNTPGQSVIGYNVYTSNSPGVTKSVTASYTPIKYIRITTANGSGLLIGTQYYMRVATIDTCGEGELSIETSFTTAS